MATKVLHNVSGRMQTFILSGAHLASHATHEHRYKPVRTVTVHQSANGQLLRQSVARALPDSLRLAAGETREVDEALVFCPDVQAAITRGLVRVSDPAEKPAASQPTT